MLRSPLLAGLRRLRPVLSLPSRAGSSHAPDHGHHDAAHLSAGAAAYEKQIPLLWGAAVRVWGRARGGVGEVCVWGGDWGGRARACGGGSGRVEGWGYLPLGKNRCPPHSHRAPSNRPPTSNARPAPAAAAPWCETRARGVGDPLLLHLGGRGAGLLGGGDVEKAHAARVGARRGGGAGAQVRRCAAPPSPPPNPFLARPPIPAPSCIARAVPPLTFHATHRAHTLGRRLAGK